MPNEPSMWDRVRGATVSVGTAVWNNFLGDDIRTLRDPKKPLWEKAVAVVDIATTVIPEGEVAKLAGKFVAKEIVKTAVVHGIEHNVEKQIAEATAKTGIDVTRRVIEQTAASQGRTIGERAVKRIETIPFAGLRADAAAALKKGGAIGEIVHEQGVRSVAQGTKNVLEGDLSKRMTRAVETGTTRGIVSTIRDGTKNIAMREVEKHPTTAAGRLFKGLETANKRYDAVAKPLEHAAHGVQYAQSARAGFIDPTHAAAAAKPELEGAWKHAGSVTKGAAGLGKITTTIDRVLHTRTNAVLGYANTAAAFVNAVPKTVELANAGMRYAHDASGAKHEPHQPQARHAPAAQAQAAPHPTHPAAAPKPHNGGERPPAHATTPWNGKHEHTGTVVHRSDEHAHVHVGKKTYIEFQLNDPRVKNPEAFRYNHTVSIDRQGVAHDGGDRVQLQYTNSHPAHGIAR